MSEENKPNKDKVAKFKADKKLHTKGPKFSAMDPITKEKIIYQVSLHGNKARAARDVGVHINSISYHIKNDPDFGRAMLQAKDGWAEVTGAVLEQEALKRAVGTDQVKFNSKGEALIDPRTGEYVTENTGSDKVLLQMLERFKPEYSKTQKIEHSGAIEAEAQGLTNSILDRINKLTNMNKAIQEIEQATDAEIVEDGEEEGS